MEPKSTTFTLVRDTDITGVSGTLHGHNGATRIVYDWE